MYYEASDFLETADSNALKRIARTRELTRLFIVIMGKIFFWEMMY